jgi:hypothetical protein
MDSKMNERINEFIKQSYVTVQSPSGEGYTHFSQEKFAELIVKECARIVDEPYDFKTPANQRTYRYPLSGETVLEHFGVEE